ncbi:MAG: arginine--tRNA ligase [Candidatus Omnitrophota bacterium]|jgi:arginyl-tRNA synthetase
MKERKLDGALIELIKKSLSDAQIGPDFKEEICLEVPRDSRFGDISTNVAMRLSKVVKKNPAELARLLTEAINRNLGSSEIKKYIREVKIAGAGFINFTLSQEYFYAQLEEILSKKADYAKQDIGKQKPVLIEFVSANPTGPLSVAHARQAVVGDALASILSELGFKVSREYYLNDEGNQINILGRSTQLRLSELKGEKIEFPEDHYQGEYIYDIARELLNNPGLIKDDPDFFPTYAADYILSIIRKELDDFGVRFDCWYSQKSLRKSGKIEKALEVLKEKGFIYEQEGAVWFKSTAFGDDKDRVVIKSDGSYTYLAPDIAYHQEKYNRGFEWLINLWGPDHHGYISRLKASCVAFGKDARSVDIIIVQLATIYKDGKELLMSTRRGQYITLREVMDEVGVDASRFFFLMRRTDSHLDFDLELAKQQTSQNPVYYVQYAHARICSILKNAAITDQKSADFGLLKEKEELQLIKSLAQLPQVLRNCLSGLDPSLITVYLQELATDFHKFYDLHRVLTEDKALSQARLGLIDATRIILAKGLDVLGVKAPAQM